MRPIDADALTADLIQSYTANADVYLVVRKILDDAPTVDVVPREELEAEITAALESNYKAKAMDMADDFVAYCEGRIHALRWISEFIEELKEKYTEGDNGTN